MSAKRPYDNEIIVINNFISDDHINEILSMADSLSDEDWSDLNYQSNENFKDKNYSLGAFLSDLRHGLENRARDIISTSYGVDQQDFFLTGFNLISRTTGAGMEVHSDGGDGKTQLTIYGLVIYLNEGLKDFNGGELYYPELGITYIPKAGDLVIHPGSDQYRHGVMDVTSGVRYIITSFAKTVKEY